MYSLSGPTKFVDWLLEIGYLDKEDISTDGVEIARDMNEVKKVAPKFYNMLMCMCDCNERAKKNINIENSNNEYFGNVRWHEDDLKSALNENGFSVTDKNVTKLYNRLQHHSFTDHMVAAGWDFINATIFNLNLD